MGRVKNWAMENNMITEKDITDYADAFPPKVPESVRASVLNEANKIVNGERANTYGGPEDSFRTIAGLWEAYLNKPGNTFAPISPADVASMLALLKIARLKTSPNHRDSWVDLAGYAACGAECGLKGK